MSNQVYDEKTGTPGASPPSGSSEIPDARYLPPGYYSAYHYTPPDQTQYNPPPQWYGGYPPPSPYRSDPRGKVVGFWPRAVAMIIDGFIVGIPSGIFYSLITLATFRPFIEGWNYWGTPHYQFSWGTSIIFWGLYAWLCYAYFNGNTLGKSVMNLKLVSPDGSKPSLQTFLLHYTVGYFVNGLVLALGYLWVVFDSGKQTWGQKLFKDSTVRGNW